MIAQKEAQVKMPDREAVLTFALSALDKSWESWFTLEERISKGKEYVTSHPHDSRATALLTTLTGQAETARRRYECANVTYVVLCEYA